MGFCFSESFARQSPIISFLLGSLEALVIHCEHSTCVQLCAAQSRPEIAKITNQNISLKHPDSLRIPKNLMTLEFSHSNYQKGKIRSCPSWVGHTCCSPPQFTGPTSFTYVTHWVLQVFEFTSPGLNHVWPLSFPKNLVLDVAQNKTPILKVLQSSF